QPDPSGCAERRHRSRAGPCALRGRRTSPCPPAADPDRRSEALRTGRRHAVPGGPGSARPGLRPEHRNPVDGELHARPHRARPGAGPTPRGEPHLDCRSAAGATRPALHSAIRTTKGGTSMIARRPSIAALLCALLPAWGQQAEIAPVAAPKSAILRPYFAPEV